MGAPPEKRSTTCSAPPLHPYRVVVERVLCSRCSTLLRSTCPSGAP
jgi:hypothetical protein